MKTSLAARAASIGLTALCLGAPADAQVPWPAEGEIVVDVELDEAALPSDPPAAPEKASPPFEEPYFPFLADEDPTSAVSVGGTSGGFVVNARRFEETPSCGLLPAHQGRDLSWGTAELVELVHEVGDRLYGATGTRLWVGNMSRRGGGDIEYSVSHDSGRDVDLALPYVDAHGRPVDPQDYVRLDAQGRSTSKGWRFDAGRAWTIVEALATAKAAQVQYVFVSGPLRKRILDAARARGAPARTVDRAAALLKQPGGAPHDDHMHVRIACSRRDVEAGCRRAGVVHPWLDLFDDARARRAEIATHALEAGDAAERRRGLERLVLLDARDRLGSIRPRLDDVDRDVRAAAAHAIARLGNPEETKALAERFGREDDLGVRAALLDAAAMLGGPRAGALLRDAVAAESSDLWTIAAARPALLALDAPPAPLLPVLALLPAAQPREPHRDALRLVAMEAASRSDRPEPVDALLPLLSHDDPELRAHAALALARLTNVAYGARWGDPSQEAAIRDAAAVAWRRFTGDVRRASRDAWLVAGFRAAGYAVPRIEKSRIWELVRAIAGPDHVSYNAERVLVRLAELDAPLPSSSRKEACGAYLRWFSVRRHAHDLARAPASTIRACAR